MKMIAAVAAVAAAITTKTIDKFYAFLVAVLWRFRAIRTGCVPICLRQIRAATTIILHCLAHCHNAQKPYDRLVKCEAIVMPGVFREPVWSESR